MMAASLKPDMFSKISNCATVTLFFYRIQT